MIINEVKHEIIDNFENSHFFRSLHSITNKHKNPALDLKRKIVRKI